MDLAKDLIETGTMLVGENDIGIGQSLLVEDETDQENDLDVNEIENGIRTICYIATSQSGQNSAHIDTAKDTSQSNSRKASFLNHSRDVNDSPLICSMSSYLNRRLGCR